MLYAKIDVLIYFYLLGIYLSMVQNILPMELQLTKKTYYRDYIYYGTKALLETYPFFRNRSDRWENMLMNESDIAFLADSMVKAVTDYIKRILRETLSLSPGLITPNMML